MTILSLLSARADAAIGDDAIPLRDAAAALTAALAHLRDDDRAAARQDGLDLIGVIAGIKPVCVFGRGARDGGWIDAARIIAACAALPALVAAPWDPEDAGAVLPSWYRAATARRRARHPVFYVCRDEATLDEAAALSAKGRVPAAEESRLLGYPPCCVAAHHGRALALEQLVAELTERIAAGDAARMMRMIEAGAAPLPRTQDEWRRYQAATVYALAAGTSVTMCEACAANRDRPAQALSRRYRALADLARYAFL